MWYTHQVCECKVMCTLTGVQPYRRFMATLFWKPNRIQLSFMKGCMINLKAKKLLSFGSVTRQCGGKKDQLLDESRETLCVSNKFMYASSVLNRSYGLKCTSPCVTFTQRVKILKPQYWETVLLTFIIRSLLQLTQRRGDGQNMRCDNVKHFCGIFGSAYRH